MVLTGLAIALTLAQPPAPGRVEGTARQPAPQTDETIAVQRGGRLVVNNFAGEVIVRTWEKDALRVVARHQPRTRVSIRPGSSGVSISSSGSMGPASVDYEITAPVWMPLRIEGTYNFVNVEGTQAEILANTVRGDVIIKGGAGVVTAKSVEGEVQIAGARGKVTASSVNEKVSVTDTTGDISAESVNGSITMTGIDAKIVDATSVNGTIIYEGKLADGGHYSLGTHNGDIILGLPETPNATFTFRTYQGSINTDFALEGYSPSQRPRGRRITGTIGNGSADVNLESFGGSIRLRKGAAARPRGR
jgi:DUF4097 and DUF4098 domain-containing protein YvlB